LELAVAFAHETATKMTAAAKQLAEFFPLQTVGD
jgi:hypothetical protein